MDVQELTTASLDKEHLQKLHELADFDDRSATRYLHRLIDREYANRNLQREAAINAS